MSPYTKLPPSLPPPFPCLSPPILVFPSLSRQPVLHGASQFHTRLKHTAGVSSNTFQDDISQPPWQPSLTQNTRFSQYSDILEIITFIVCSSWPKDLYYHIVTTNPFLCGIRVMRWDTQAQLATWHSDFIHIYCVLSVMFCPVDMNVNSPRKHDHTLHTSRFLGASGYLLTEVSESQMSFTQPRSYWQRSSVSF